MTNKYAIRVTLHNGLRKWYGYSHGQRFLYDNLDDQGNYISFYQQQEHADSTHTRVKETWPEAVVETCVVGMVAYPVSATVYGDGTCG